MNDTIEFVQEQMRRPAADAPPRLPIMGSSGCQSVGVMKDDEILLLYDRQCPACDYFCRLLRIRESVGAIRLVDARTDGPLLAEITRLGLDIDQGMVVKMDEAIYYGADAIHALALIGTRSGAFNRLNHWIFRSQRRSRLLYPLLRALRNLLLKFLGRTKINNLGLRGNDRF